MPEKVTIRQIAEKIGVSVATVSIALHNKPGVSDEIRAKVKSTAKKMGYILKTTPLVVHHERLNTLGLLVKTEPNLSPPSNPFYSRVIAGVDEACKDLGLNLLFSMLPVDEHNRPQKLPPFIKDNMVDGFLMVGTFLDETISFILEEWTVPIVLVDGYSDTERYDMVVSDNFGASYQAVEYLIIKGHKHIAMIGGEPKCYPSLRDRRHGYARAVKDSALENLYYANFNISSSQGEIEVAELLKNNPQITAVFAINDNVAVSAIQTVQKMGMRVPDDISVIGYDDTVLATMVTPKLTTMQVDTIAMGQGSAHLVSLRMHRPDAKRITLVVHPQLIERESVSTPRL
jgi:DNA-binding LacI/PurR family transcriptional regulator